MRPGGDFVDGEFMSGCRLQQAAQDASAIHNEIAVVPLPGAAAHWRRQLLRCSRNPGQQRTAGLS